MNSTRQETTMRTTTLYTLRAATNSDSTREVNEATARLYNAASAILPSGVSDSHGSTSGWEFSPTAVLPYASVSFRIPTSDEDAREIASQIRAQAGHTGPFVLTTGLGIHQRTVA
jgi:hypothetical protein